MRVRVLDNAIILTERLRLQEKSHIIFQHNSPLDQRPVLAVEIRTNPGVDLAEVKVVRNFQHLNCGIHMAEYCVRNLVVFSYVVILSLFINFSYHFGPVLGYEKGNKGVPVEVLCFVLKQVFWWIQAFHEFVFVTIWIEGPSTYAIVFLVYQYNVQASGSPVGHHY